MKFNFYQFTSRMILAVFMMLSTIQILLNAGIRFGTDIPITEFIIICLLTFIPILFLVVIMMMIHSKIMQLMLINNVKFTIRVLLYSLIVMIFTLWSFIVIASIDTYTHPLVEVSSMLIDEEVPPISPMLVEGKLPLIMSDTAITTEEQSGHKTEFTQFFLKHVLYSIVYAIIVIIFFHSLSDIDLKILTRRK